MRRRSSHAAVALFFSLALLPFSARAQQPPPTTATTAAPEDPLVAGKREFELGGRELNLGHYESSLQHFESSYRLTAKPALLYNLAYVNKLLFERTKDVAYIEKSVELLHKCLDTTTADDPDPRTAAAHAKCDSELKGADAELTRERATRAKGEETLAVAEEYLRKLQIEEARGQLESFERTPGNERAGVIRALLLRGGIAVVQGHAAEATEAYASALELDRSLTVDKSVVVPLAFWLLAVDAFNAAQTKMTGSPVLTVAHAAPGSMKVGKPLSLTFTGSSDPNGLVHGVRLLYRVGSGAFSSLPQAPLGVVSLPREFLATLLPGAKIEYYANVVDKNNAVLQHFGTAALPFVVEVEKPPTNYAKKGWLWGTVAAVVVVGVGAGVTAYELGLTRYTDVPINTSSALSQ